MCQKCLGHGVISLGCQDCERNLRMDDWEWSELRNDFNRIPYFFDFYPIWLKMFNSVYQTHENIGTRRKAQQQTDWPTDLCAGDDIGQEIIENPTDSVEKTEK
jgi:hypothetical protein